ncbi:methyltransferase domain-containing protein [Algoriphagus halophytocola]|uniref:Methyltransferase domain-containing protein n=1 Tax=Algoriphagus halophytocola TaxID=2991499 RepID=A0ABY6MJP6_9BACT|nr:MULTISPECIES: methyltransferase domain-containing protein [unclassified Algoriphagus]UZD23719.1 methyltransferase domain-containing protein [Algoriphagus sp. TR-M5]WBL45013.1 methyltransferase domain-containing protein [Algoriphagus sp. TR-M9]
MGKSDLLLELYSNLSTTGAVTFSSKALVNKMLSHAQLNGAKLIVELGGGDGSITQGIVERMDPDAELLVFEISKSFCDSMEKIFPQSNVRIINDSAENIHKYLDGKKADYILSSLPFSFIPQDVKDAILSSSKSALSQSGYFIQICYSYLLKNLFKKHFNKVSTSFTLKNLPPAFVMVCK